MPRIEAANSLDIQAFKDIYFQEGGPDQRFEHAFSKISKIYTITLEFSSTMSRLDLDACFTLIASTSASAYSSSSIGWSASKKRKEMRLPDLRYLLIKESATSLPEGFLSFMLTYEDGHEVIYCYEIHLSAHLQRCGLGKHMVAMMEDVGSKVAIEKAMLSVFVKNQAAMSFYDTMGYQIDEFSPEPRTLRNGRVKEPDYVILSKVLSSRIES
ncbi:hypothetical protein MMC14_010035 [Varicellaria rhodocarpa]|nr:hypothetical protein [Varicellaria rhodocarpa]